MTAPATVRPAQEADVDEIVDTTWAVAEEGRWIATEVPFDRAERAAMVRTGLADPAHAGWFVAEMDGRVVGHVGIRLARFGVASLGMLVVASYRGKGVGRALLTRAIEWAGTSGAHKVALEVWPDNEGAIALYRRAGFEPEGRLRSHYRRRNGEAWDAIVMGLLLQ